LRIEDSEHFTTDTFPAPPLASYALVTSFLTIEKADAIWVWQGELNIA
jgi:hypothetical protein